MQVLDKPSAFATALKTLLQKNLSYRQSVALWVLHKHFGEVPSFDNVMHPDYAIVVNSLAVMMKEEMKKEDEKD